ncbi:hypothetical protein CC85DRAFT_283693 [Cutaneotrichosporon oleaginosum]|uniref:FYVE-type domain-containing protein n=1 Tax=Cutaneotrichosporon oleaginosum TaxID=879819 RepID=A0A0J0XSX3_9TREE|nr:uncharacterized protein CC85DRAFT_283693 [Cutaneotrichosporon oleaginosum]KLT44172.1 hypothetical protein CC85DRAFT_283693 [Cutaneotrichosporon oleaginosum]TXT11657.1 hypothetical protein COLE_02067 [Cutaneotrichosporon oleaginosum]
MAQPAPGAANNPPRRFGARPSSIASASSLTIPPPGPASASNSAFALSHTPLAPQPQRARSSSAVAQGTAVAAAQQWLSALAPRGEGRGREFLTSTLSGVANVATTVGQELNGVIARGAHSRTGSYAGNVNGNGNGTTSPPLAELPFAPRANRRDSLASRRDSSIASPVPPPTAPAPTNTRRLGPPPPANARRLGRESAPPAPQAQALVDTPTEAVFRTLSPSPTAAAFQRTNSIERRPGHNRTGSIPLSTSPAPSAASTGSRRARGTPYKIGFQPSGVRRDRTAAFTTARKENAAEREKEEGRLNRRWAKLVDLHFNPSTQTSPLARSGSSSFSLSSIVNARPQVHMDDVVDSLKPRQVWKGLKAAAGPGPEEARKRAEEQRIVKWEPDSEVRKCRVCAAPFSLSTRKHHCRLCGRIVCSLPPTPPALLAVQMQLFAEGGELPPGTRREKCSLLLVADWRTGRGEEVEEGFVGWMSLDQEKEPAAIRPSRHHRHRSGSVLSDTSSTTTSDEPQRTIPLPQQPQEVQVKGVRVCRECWATVSRKQKIADRTRITPFARLYAALRSLQAEIAGLLPSFEEDVAALQRASEDTEPSASLLASHKTLLALLGQYDALAKRVSAAPCEPGGSQAAVQRALARSAAEFMARAAVTAQELPRLQRRAAAARARTMVVVEQRLPDVLKAEGIREDAAEDVARALQPLLEQQAQLEYVC